MQTTIPSPDYRFLARLQRKSGASLEVPANLFLPKSIGERPKLLLFPRAQEWHSLGYASPCALTGTLDDGMVVISSPELHIGGGSYKPWGEENLSEAVFEGHLYELTISRRYGQNRRESRRVRGSYHLTSSLILWPPHSPQYHSDGKVNWRRGRRITFELSEEITLSFDLEFRFEPQDTNSTIMSPELAAQFDYKSEKNPADFLNMLDDLLLLVSLAERQRCACMRITWRRGNMVTQEFRNRSAPHTNPKHSFNSFLITSEFERFLHSAFSNFKANPQRDLLRNALQSATNLEGSTLEEQYLRLFTALESVLLSHRRTGNLEYIITSEDDRKTLERDLKKFIRSHSLLHSDKESRKRLYSNLKAMERVPLVDILSNFCETSHVDLGDLWPVYSDKSGDSLADLRNRIVHGEFIAEPDWRHIIEAKQCLRIIVERCLLAALGWSYKGTRAHRLNSNDERRWRIARSALSQH